MFLLHGQDRHLIAALHRFQNTAGHRGLRARIAGARGKLAHAFWTILSGSDIAREAKIARSVRFPHLNGVVIHREAVVEEDCLIMQQVTLGQTAKAGAPRVCRGAYIGAGAKVLGPVTIGHGARIGANAVVLTDVPEGATAVGVPARIVERDRADPERGGRSNTATAPDSSSS
ncbi:serine O-acetyltransferase [Rhodovulum steppense]|uniref:Serine acetyltransferase n=1 Tax=Rhodovulum steppense TaxID=540251 RepID=A0A4V2R3W7_9RHOB|nr:serine acetyltransferase [Rhodovulum steppense]TCM78968.1 serine O-acetyltransferase [Rhodovulum steppense]